MLHSHKSCNSHGSGSGIASRIKVTGVAFIRRLQYKLELHFRRESQVLPPDERCNPNRRCIQVRAACQVRLARVCIRPEYHCDNICRCCNSADRDICCELAAVNMCDNSLQNHQCVWTRAAIQTQDTGACIQTRVALQMRVIGVCIQTSVAHITRMTGTWGRRDLQYR